MKISALSYLALASTVAAQTITVDSLNEDQASAVSSRLGSYLSEVADEAVDVALMIITATDYPSSAETPFTDIGQIFYTFNDPEDFARLTSSINNVITTSVEAEGAMQTYVDFYQSVATAQASIINEIGAAPGSNLRMGMWTLAMIVAGVAVVLL